MTLLVKYEAACRALEEAHRVDEVKDIHDKAVAMRAYAIQAKNADLEVMAAEVRVRAERRLGELIEVGKANGTIVSGRPRKSCAREDNFSQIHLADMGIDPKLSRRSQILSGIPAAAFEAMVARTREDIITGRRSADILKGSNRATQQQARRDLERSLSDETARLASGSRRFPVIYADPATRFRAGIGNRSIENHYPTMTTEQICALPIADRCLPNCRLYIWTTVPQLANTIALILPAWGFTYSSCCVWDKTDHDHENEVGTGLVFRNQHELLIYATKGSPAGPAVKPKSIYRERKREHSRKPDYYRQMINEMTGGLPVLELFARVDDEHPLPSGWEAWGNQAAPVPLDASASPPTRRPEMSKFRHLHASDPSLEIPPFLRRGHPECLVQECKRGDGSG